MKVSAIDSALVGMQRAQQKVDRSAASLAEPLSETSDTVRDVTDLKTGVYEFKAGVLALKKSLEMQESVLDLLA